MRFSFALVAAVAPLLTMAAPVKVTRAVSDTTIAVLSKRNNRTLKYKHSPHCRIRRTLGTIGNRILYTGFGKV